MGDITAMSEAVTAAPAPLAVRMPPATRIPKLFQGMGFAISRRGMMRRLARRYGNVFTLHLPIYGRVVVVGDPQLAKRIFTTSPEELGNIQPNLSRLFGSGSVCWSSISKGSPSRSSRGSGGRAGCSRARRRRSCSTRPMSSC